MEEKLKKTKKETEGVHLPGLLSVLEDRKETDKQKKTLEDLCYSLTRIQEYDKEETGRKMQSVLKRPLLQHLRLQGWFKAPKLYSFKAYFLKKQIYIFIMDQTVKTN